MTDAEEIYGKNVHIWTEEEICEMHAYGIWFYGLVRDETGDITISEIHPGFGYCNWEIYPDDGDGKPLDPMEQYAEIGSDILVRSPDQLAAEFPGAVEPNFRIEEELREPSVPFDFKDDRSLLLKLLDARYVIDWYLDNCGHAYYGDEIEGCDNDDLYDHIDMLVKYGILQETTFGCYQLNKDSPITQALIMLDELVAEKGENECK